MRSLDPTSKKPLPVSKVRSSICKFGSDKERQTQQEGEIDKKIELESERERVRDTFREKHPFIDIERDTQINKVKEMKKKKANKCERE